MLLNKQRPTVAAANGNFGRRERLREVGFFIKALPFADSSVSRLFRWPPLTLAAVLFAVPAEAAIVPAASCAQNIVQTAIGSALSGDTVTVPAGTCSWTSSIPLPANKDLTVQGATVVNCTGTPGTSGYSCTATNNTALTCNNGCFDLNFAASHRITGFTMTGSGNGELVSCSNGNQNVNKHFRVDHNRLVSTSGWQPIRCFGDSNAVHPQGIWDHNRLENGIAIHTNGTDYLLNESNAQHQLWAQDPQLGGTSRIFVEDNYFVTSVQTTNFTDGNYGARVAIRGNSTNGPTITGFEFHSPQGENRGFQSWETYNNYLSNLDTTDDCYFGMALIRGGSGVFFNNAMAGSIAGCNQDASFDNVRSAWTSAVGGVGPCDGSSPWDQNTGTQGYHCRDQVGAVKDAVQWNHSPAGAWNQQLSPAYAWGNTKPSGSAVFTVVGGGRNSVHIVKNRDYYEYTSSFNGTAGVGVGPLSARPTSCTTNVGYWATDQGEWNSLNAGNDGQLYKCTTANTWTLYYTPYLYPHPWAGGSTQANACDVNDDGSTNVSDVQLCVNQAINAAACTSGDINTDGSCNVIDVQRVVNAALGGSCVTQ